MSSGDSAFIQMLILMKIFFDDLGSIDDLISSDKKIKMSEKRALEILEKFFRKKLVKKSYK